MKSHDLLWWSLCTASKWEFLGRKEVNFASEIELTLLHGGFDLDTWDGWVFGEIIESDYQDTMMFVEETILVLLGACPFVFSIVAYLCWRKIRNGTQRIILQFRKYYLLFLAFVGIVIFTHCLRDLSSSTPQSSPTSAI